MIKMLYAYRYFPAGCIEERLNEAYQRGWKLHTFCDVTNLEGVIASVVFQWAGTPSTVWQSPFADDEEEGEE
ncbi:hypothetical protein LCGC14_0735280 [marine sediment metagenome]|uniref:DUF4177 domain-containing protein n=1 Tax=marine sediment metagenome TaxID=412755 RepID=A0A0F9TFK8_9ZZZZ